MFGIRFKLNITVMAHPQYQQCAEACLECVIACNQCAISCLSEKTVADLKDCIQLDLECAAICSATADLLNINSKYVSDICALCVKVCDACAVECEKHALMGMEHCRRCAEACRNCSKECSWLMAGKISVDYDFT